MQKAEKITDYQLYRKRYLVSYVLLGLGIIYLIYISLFVAPKGVSNSEIQSSVSSFYNISFDNLIEAPYHLIQKASIKLFGLSNITIKLPSMIFGLLSLILLVLVSRLWTDKKTSIIASVGVIATSQFMFIIQDGTPKIMLIFWMTLLLAIIHTLLTIFQENKEIKHRKKYFNLIMLFSLPMIGLSLYTPFSGYIWIAVAISSLLHPHIRFVIREAYRSSDKKTILTSLFITVLILLPLGVSIFKNPSQIFSLLGFDTKIDIVENVKMLSKGLFSTRKIITTHQMILPLFNLPGLIIIAIGIGRAISRRDKFNKVLILTWFATAVFITILTKNAILILFTPMYLLFTIGINHIIVSWYKLFPRNPYARTAGFIPIMLLLVSLSVSGINEFINTFYYQTDIAPSFRDDLVLIKNNIKKDEKATIVTDSDLEYNFYRILSDKNQNISVDKEFYLQLENKQLVTHRIYKKYNLINIQKILTDQFMLDGNRFYIYKN